MGKAVIYYILLFLLCSGCVGYFAYDDLVFEDKFDTKSYSEYSIDGNMPTRALGGYQASYACLTPGEEVNADYFKDDTYAALLIDNETNEVVVAHNALRRIYPASTTKLMTALVVCDALYNGEISLDDVVTLQHDTQITEYGALISNLRAGYSISVRNLLYGLLMRSYNDYAVILAEYISGDVDTFCDRMNTKAYQIGATGSHFANPHGLHQDNHYVTAYDMYLILKEAAKYDIITEIDSYSSFSYSFTDDNGNEWKDDISPTNQYLSGQYSIPSNIDIMEWKTGTTNAAGNILCMNFYVNNKNYSLFVADGVSQDDLYDKIGTMFNITN